MKKNFLLTIVLIGTMLFMAACSTSSPAGTSSGDDASIEVLEFEDEESAPEESEPVVEEEISSEEEEGQTNPTDDILAAVGTVMDEAQVVWVENFDNLSQINHWYLEGDFQLENGILSFPAADFRPVNANEAIAYYAAQAGYDGMSQAVHVIFSYSGGRMFKMGASYKSADSYENFGGGGAEDEFMISMQPSSNIPNPNPYLAITSTSSSETGEYPMEGNTFLEEGKSYEMVMAIDNPNQTLYVVIWESGNYGAGLAMRLQDDELLKEETSAAKPWGFSIYQWGGGSTVNIDSIEYLAFESISLP
ncbi:MAG: hypothetical protein GYA52_07520 [Chloroflexi bacterium]|nr:hypothetical protein [Chloroflexota bacterium]